MEHRSPCPILAITLTKAQLFGHALSPGQDCALLDDLHAVAIAALLMEDTPRLESVRGSFQA
ncbi:hypothetical protein PHISCL_08109 [Aspergillus sclerotialis]|uniref:Uncharacterized protein n=1 Tax=Aspergillus sclerotialis TaxID=2070753 RepID=A0A3A2ZJL5_9EURO|nr:hypothetical protein PHISCL_08109 [Aspergillus sclerotialis]